MIIENGRKLNRSSWSFLIGLGEIILAILLWFYPDLAKIFLFALPVALLALEGCGLLYGYFKRKKSIFHFFGGIILLGIGVFLLFCGRKTFMVGVAVLMLMESYRFLFFASSRQLLKLEKFICCCAAILSFSWMLLILFKGLHLYWSVRDYLAFYFLGCSLISFLHRR